jgi:hypothetical protein
MLLFCFLTYTDIESLGLWNSFFEQIPISKYKVFIHPKFNINPSKYTFPVHIIQKKVHTVSKSHISIVSASLQLLKEALEQSEGIGTHFFFLTQHCIPLYPFSFYERMLAQVNQSIVSCLPFTSKERYYQLHPYMKTILTYSQFVKQQPNMILIKDDVELLIHYDFRQYFQKMTCPDEHYFINVLLYIFKRNIIKQQTHFCNFNINRTQALNFNQLVDDQNFIKKIRQKGYLFLRKVSVKYVPKVIEEYILNF